MHSKQRLVSLREMVVSLPWPTLLVLALIPILGVLSGYGVSRQNILVAVIAVTAVPVGILLIRQPFNAVVVWLIVAPFFVVTYDTTTRAAYWVTHRTLIPLAAIVMLVACLTKKRLRLGWVEFFMCAFLLINIFSVLYYYPDNPIPGLYEVYDLTLVGTALFLLIRLTAPREAQWKHLMIAFILMCIVQGIVGLMMNISATRAMLPTAWQAISTNRTTGTLGRDGEFSSTLTASLLLVAHYAFHVRERPVRILIFIALVLGGLCLVLSFSRATWLASAIVVVLAVVLYRRLAPYLLATAAILVLVLSTNVFADSLAFAKERLSYQRTVDSRIISNYAHLGMIEAKPLLGWGYGNYTLYHMAFVQPVEGIAVTDPEISSHNTFLNMAVELGLLGLLIYLAPWLLLLRQSLMVYRRLPQEGFYNRHLLLLLWLGVVFWFVAFNFQNIRLGAWGITWIQFLLGLIASLVDAGQETNRGNVSQASPHPAIA